MKKPSFLNKLWNQRKISLVEPSENIYTSYLKKAENSLKSATILIQNNLHEDSISKSYYAMYNAITGLLFKTGIKCENHTVSIILLQKLFNKDKLYRIVKHAKEERIETQYYVESSTTKRSALDLFKNAEEFLISIKLLAKNLTESEIKEFRKKLRNIVKK